MTQTNTPKVSVSFITYNQERYVAQAIESVLMQETDFEYEFLISDDCSTDKTASICLDYQKRHPEKITFIARKNNVGAVRNFVETYEACRGKYVAFLEGDDYWTDPRKLQKQTDFFDANPDFTVCGHNVTVVNEEGRPSGALFGKIEEITRVQDLCKEHYIPTGSCMVRNKILDKIPEWLLALRGCDWPFCILHAEKGRIRFFNEVMGAYRRHGQGVWSGMDAITQYRVALDLVERMNSGLGYRYNEFFQSAILRSHRWNAEQALKNNSDPLLIESLTGLAPFLKDNPQLLAIIKETCMKSHLYNEMLTASASSPGGDSTQAGVDNTLLWHQYKAMLGNYQEACRVIASAEAWQKRSWFNRAFQKWDPKAAPRRAGFWRRLERSIRKRRKKFTGMLKDWNPLRKRNPHSEGGIASMETAPALRKPAYETVHYDLIILDNLFPHPLSGFRLQEYHSYLEAFDKAKVYCTADAYALFKNGKSFPETVEDFENEHPELRGKTELYDPERPLKARLIYTIFLSGASTFLEKIESCKIPFAFTLYPGGMFQLNMPESDKAMRKVFDSPWFRKVIVTQQVSYDYLVKNAFCRPDQIEFIYGVVTPLKLLNQQPPAKKHFGRDKSRLDICFVAHKYSQKGKDKGYDVFVEVATHLAAAHDNIFFHVVGGFDATVLDVSALAGKITFYGLQESGWFREFYADKDLILSPNIPFQLLDGGTFDGFPTGCCTDAALHKVAMFCTDVLKLNIKFTHGTDIVIIPNQVEEIVGIIGHYHAHPGELQRIAENGYARACEVYGYEHQIAPRIKILSDLINAEKNDAI